MRHWIISDTHFGHSMILKHRRRPEDADHRIVRNWQRLVKPEDLVIHLGDVAWSNLYRESGQLKKFLDTLPGRKVLVRGNHDSWSVTKYMQGGFAFACDALVFGSAYLTHHPEKVLPRGCQVNIHGHLHNTKPVGFQVYPHTRLFSLEYNNYEPRLLHKYYDGRRGGPPLTNLGGNLGLFI